MIGVHFADTITLGSIFIGLLLGLFGLFVFAYGARWKAAYEAEHAAAASLKDGREAFQLRAERVEAELKESMAQRDKSLQLIGEQKATIAKLEALPNLARIVEIMGETSVRQDAAADQRVELAITSIESYVAEQLAHHEARAQDRHDAQMGVMEAIADKLNEGKAA